MGSYSGKKVIIVGGIHGIGLSTAQLLVDRGAQVLVTGRSPGAIHTAQEQLGSQAHLMACDITSTAAIAQPNPATDAFFGPGTQVDLIFVNAGYAALEPFNADGGALVFTTSVANQVGIPGMATYAAAKAAVQSLVQTLAAELIGRRIRVIAVSPGFVRTPTMGVVNASADDRTTFEGEGVKATPLGCIGDPEEFASAVVFLGFEATFTTGSQVVLDGGLASLQVH